jgi:hypothetical protein
MVATHHAFVLPMSSGYDNWLVAVVLPGYVGSDNQTHLQGRAQGIDMSRALAVCGSEAAAATHR